MGIFSERAARPAVDVPQRGTHYGTPPLLRPLERFWSDLPLARKATLAVLLPVQALLLGFALLYFLSQAERNAQQAVDRTLQTRDHISSIVAEVSTARDSVSMFIIAGDERYLAEREQAHRDVWAAVGDLARLVRDEPAQEQRLANVRLLLEQMFDARTRLIHVSRTPDTPEAPERRAELLDLSRRYAADLHRELDHMRDEELQLQRVHLARVEAFREMSVAASALAVLLGLLGAIGGVWLLSKSVVRRVKLIGENADRLARDLPLTYFAGGRDEISQLARRLEYTSGMLTQRAAALRSETARLEANIAERERAERARRETDARLQAILDHTSAVVYVKDLEGAFVLVNRQFETMFGVSRHEILGRTSRDLFGSRLGQPLMDHDLEVIRRGIPLEFEEVVPQGNGERVYLSTKFPLLAQGGKPYAICGISTDITARKAGEQALRISNESLDAGVKERTRELQETNERLRQEVEQHRATAERLERTQQQFLQAQKMEALGLLAGGVAHDFNNILTAIMGYSTVLLEELPQEARDQSHIAEILRAAERAAALSKQLLAFSRRQPHQPSALDLSSVVLDLEKMLRQVLGDRVLLETQLAENLPSVLADAGQIEQILLNLVVNARDAMPGGGTIVISTSAVTLPPDEVKNGSEASEFVALSVRDNGSGIPADVQARMFEPFFTTKRQGQGTGLGLASCQSIAQQSGGWMKCESTVGRGSEFITYLPAVADSAAPRGKRDAGSALRGGTETILVVEDEPAVGEVVALLLRSLGYTVVTAEDGDEAERAVIERGADRIDLVLTDLDMPRMNGRQLMERLSSANPTLKVLLTSGNDELLDEDAAAELAVDFLPKPFTLPTLARKVRSVLDNSRGNDHG